LWLQVLASIRKWFLLVLASTRKWFLLKLASSRSLFLLVLASSRTQFLHSLYQKIWVLLLPTRKQALAPVVRQEQRVQASEMKK
jgi:hypothetical protein